MSVNTTTPTPSLNRDSPANVTFSEGETGTVLNRASTATGSVGLIRAPNTSAQTNGISCPAQPATSHVQLPMTAAETSVPAVAMSPIVRNR